MAEPAIPTPTPTAWRPRIAQGLAGTLLFLGAWIVVPAPLHALLPLSVGAPETAHLLLVSGLIVALLALADVHRSRVARFALLVAVAALILPVVVISSVPGVITSSDRAMTQALGVGYVETIAPTTRERLRPSPVSIRDLFLGLPSGDVRITAGVAFSNAGGETLAVDVYQPADGGTYPVVVQIYGGGWRSGTRGSNATFARALAAAGYVVFAIDYRHTPRWQWPAQLDDVRAALAWIKAHGGEYGADTHRIVMLGRSSGAQLALISGITAGDPDIRAIVAFFSPVNLTQGYREPGFPDTLGLRDLERAFIGGTPDDKADAYRDASPITYADRPHPPVLLVNGGQDRIVYAHYGAALHERLRVSGRSTMLVIPWANHAFDEVPFGPSGQLALYYSERFLGWATNSSRADLN